ncbi:MAG: 16S rRNA (cytosine(967)-C(5))-methyltransferase RsmB [Clostridia bacterium]|nr:16S rRNA (cytosine(967)-C(5))-methyltransferase RsmB [Clostridia bacterium]
MTAREAAFRSLWRIEKESRFSNLETDVTLKREKMSEADARLYTRLVYGTVEKKLTLDFHLARFSDQPLDRLDREVLVLLRLGAYQILYLDRVPDSAAVNETVGLCKKVRKNAAGLVNAVLRRLSKDRNVSFPDETRDPVAYLSAFFSVSPALCALFLSEFGFEECRRFLEAVSSPPPVTLRVNTLKTDRASLCALLADRGIAPSPSRRFPFSLLLPGGASALPSFDEGLFFVQDESSMAAVEALDARPGMTVMDLCACPGGKTFGSAIRMEDRGEVCSFDIHENKLPLIDGGAQRLGVSIVHTAAGDARVFLPAFENRADRVLVDAPCSGFGVMAKKPEIRYKDPAETERLPKIQRAILANAARYVKPGGRLIYSTCTVLRRENEEVVDGFLAAHPDFEEDDLRLPTVAPGKSRVTLLPQTDHTDGFFIAAMRKKER